jgi:hypothetical protein
MSCGLRHLESGHLGRSDLLLIRGCEVREAYSFSKPLTIETAPISSMLTENGFQDPSRDPAVTAVTTATTA